MKAKEVIIVDGITTAEYDKIVEDAVKYSIISLPFTIDRMRIPNEKSRALNIAKGKIAEGLFKWYCIKNNVNVNFEVCETPFWQIDKRDFMIDGFEWDIKNNFLYLEKDYFENYIYLPALIPNRHRKDQWNTRNEQKIPGSKGVRYLFTFLKGANLINGTRGDYFLEINLSTRQEEILRDLYSKFNGLPANYEPFNENDFWNDFLDDNSNLFTLNARPNLVITGYADNTIWDVFRDTGPYSNNNYIDYIQPFWYKKVGMRNSLTWFNGVLWTTITNKTAPVELLLPFNY
jgi:hypothetical protein